MADARFSGDNEVNNADSVAEGRPDINDKLPLLIGKPHAWRHRGPVQQLDPIELETSIREVAEELANLQHKIWVRREAVKSTSNEPALWREEDLRRNTRDPCGGKPAREDQRSDLYTGGTPRGVHPANKAPFCDVGEKVEKRHKVEPAI